jgi:hypothetical protein
MCDHQAEPKVPQVDALPIAGDGEQAPDLSDIKVEWMWADAGVSFARSLTDMNPLRWSSGSAQVIADALSRETSLRPVKIKVTSSKLVLFEMNQEFQSPTEAAQFLQEQTQVFWGRLPAQIGLAAVAHDELLHEGGLQRSVSKLLVGGHISGWQLDFVCQHLNSELQAAADDYVAIFPESVNMAQILCEQYHPAIIKAMKNYLNHLRVEDFGLPIAHQLFKSCLASWNLANDLASASVIDSELCADDPHIMFKGVLDKHVQELEHKLMLWAERLCDHRRCDCAARGQHLRG